MKELLTFQIPTIQKTCSCGRTFFVTKYQAKREFCRECALKRRYSQMRVAYVNKKLKAIGE